MCHEYIHDNELINVLCNVSININRQRGQIDFSHFWKRWCDQRRCNRFLELNRNNDGDGDGEDDDEAILDYVPNMDIRIFVSHVMFHHQHQLMVNIL